MLEGEDAYPDDWISYEAYAEEQGSIMLEHSPVPGPGPPGPPGPPEFLLPPPPLPGGSTECSSFSSHFDTCDISKVILSHSVVLCPKTNEHRHYVFILTQSGTYSCVPPEGRPNYSCIIQP